MKNNDNEIISFLKKLFRNVIFEINDFDYNFIIKEHSIHSYVNDKLATNKEHIEIINKNLDNYLGEELIKFLNNENKPILIFPNKYHQELNNDNIYHETYDYKKHIEIFTIEDIWERKKNASSL